MLQVRRTAVSMVLLAGGLSVLALAPAASGADTVTPPATPQGACGPGSLPESDIQGRVPGDGSAVDGFRCNVEVIGQHGNSGGYKVERYVDETGRECAIYDTTLLFPSNAGNLANGPTGVAVLDMTDPANPVQTATLSTPAMQTPHESLLVNAERGLIAAVSGNPIFGPGQVDLYDASKDCRTPTLASTLPVGTLGHESGFAPDGNTFYAASLGGGVLTAIDVTDPTAPSVLTAIRADTHAVTLSDDGRTAYLAATAGFPRNEIGLTAELSGVVVLDVSQIQDRVVNPQTEVIGGVTWPTITIPQAALPVTIDGKPYLVEGDEFSTDEDGRIAGNGPRVGAARIIDIADPADPKVIADLRLAVHDPAVRPSLAGDPDATSSTGGYAGHYCAVPQRTDPGIVACSDLASGLRVFDITDPRSPREIAYFVAPVADGGPANSAFSSASFVPERNEIWYSDGDRGFYALRLTNGVWPAAARVPAGAAPTGQVPPGQVPASSAAAPSKAPSASAAPAAGNPASTTSARSGALPATGPAVPVLAGAVLLGAALTTRRLTRRS